MSLSCLTCKILRTDSENELKARFNVDKNSKEKSDYIRPEMSWSGNFAPRPENMAHSPRGPVNKVKKGSRRLHNSGPVEFPGGSPRLVRSPGMRRDWSFEDLQRQLVK
uniref:Uncharacterized protein n=1 Tax=Nicotiana tabacum TaxID=4097 RepID=A0A1S3YZW1_TOBAC|nr:PREDICTED: uncharacterized protein LOC107781636 [Nicotiana tabacum]